MRTSQISASRESDYFTDEDEQTKKVQKLASDMKSKLAGTEKSNA